MQKLRSEKSIMDMDKLNFEDAMKRIDEIVERLEDSTLKLDDSLVLYEEGVSLVAHCRKKLEEAQRRITYLTPNENGEMVEKIFSAEEER